MKRGKVILIAGATLGFLLLAAFVARDAFGSPAIPAQFDAAAFKGFEGWDRDLEEWTLVGADPAEDLRNRTVFLIDVASGSLIETLLWKDAGKPHSSTANAYYRVTQQSTLPPGLSKPFTGTLVFREKTSFLIRLGFEPRRTSLRYFRGRLVDSLTTRTDL